MTQLSTNELLKDFQVEIEKSAVISDHFKTWLVGRMMSMASVAHKHGYNEGIKEERKRFRQKKK